MINKKIVITGLLLVAIFSLFLLPTKEVVDYSDPEYPKVIQKGLIPAVKQKVTEILQPSQNSKKSDDPFPDAVDIYARPETKNVDKQDLGQFQEMVKKDHERIMAYMRKAELASLKESIVNDLKSLKMIEEKGGDIETYQFIERTLEKRKQRLKELTASQKETK